MAGAPPELPNWGDLLQLALHWISKKVKSITDFIRFPAILFLWRFASLPKSRRLPWLMIPYDQNIHGNDDGTRLFYDLWECKMRMLHLPDIIGKKRCASHRGWFLVTATKGIEVFLLNPLTQERIELPPLTQQVRYLGEDWDAPRHDTPNLFSTYPVQESKMTFSCDLTDPDSDRLIMVFLYRQVIICCRVRDPCWTIIKSPLGFDPDDATYYNGQFYLLYDKVNCMVIVDPDEPEEWDFHDFGPELEAVRMGLLEGKSGVYLVGMKALIQGQRDKYELYQFQEQPFNLKHITDTSNTAIFTADDFWFLAVCSDYRGWLGGGYMYTVPVISPAKEDGVRCYRAICSAKLDDGEMGQQWTLHKAPLIGPNEPFMWFQPSFV
ncbi:hypothetical protein LUZ61_015300 [Rhynchospora tenuis]|uniref:KIB1-4 beta-propeller domain-containing protein n=1 Tax=Rhynchospora tenuis TaxID=198213 RepID=A0AAD5Z3K2_9POAL|nr:hypothetical protein LUZ61_015300 [Rhynchospora tenuis]